MNYLSLTRKETKLDEAILSNLSSCLKSSLKLFKRAEQLAFLVAANSKAKFLDNWTCFNVPKNTNVQR